MVIPGQSKVSRTQSEMKCR